jgi:hypothetical protein
VELIPACIELCCRLEEYVDAATGAQFIDQWSLKAPQTAKPDSGTDVWHDAIRFTNRLVNRAYHAKQRGSSRAADAGSVADAGAGASSVGGAVDRDNDAEAPQRTDRPSTVRAVDEGDRPLPPNDADDDNDGHEHLYSGHECQFFQNRIVQVWLSIPAIGVAVLVLIACSTRGCALCAGDCQAMGTRAGGRGRTQNAQQTR